VDAWAVLGAVQSDGHCEAPFLEPVRDCRPSASAGEPALLVASLELLLLPQQRVLQLRAVYRVDPAAADELWEAHPEGDVQAAARVSVKFLAQREERVWSW
jgi:hypothetical protein